MLGSNPPGISGLGLNSAHGLVTTDKLQSAHILNVGAFFGFFTKLFFSFLKNAMYLCA
jgi:hypothetical protein